MYSAENEKLRLCHSFPPSLRRAEPVTTYSYGPQQQARTRNLPRTGVAAKTPTLSTLPDVAWGRLPPSARDEWQTGSLPIP